MRVIGNLMRRFAVSLHALFGGSQLIGSRRMLDQSNIVRAIHLVLLGGSVASVLVSRWDPISRVPSLHFRVIVNLVYSFEGKTGRFVEEEVDHHSADQVAGGKDEA